MNIETISAFVQTPQFLIIASVVFFILFLFGVVEDGHRKFTNEYGNTVYGNGTPVDKEKRKELNIGGAPCHWTDYEKDVIKRKELQRNQIISDLGNFVNNIKKPFISIKRFITQEKSIV